jgi:hypothetical protein
MSSLWQKAQSELQALEQKALMNKKKRKCQRSALSTDAAATGTSRNKKSRASYKATILFS